MNISLAAEPIFHFATITITNSVFTAWLIVAFLLLGTWLLRRRLTAVPGRLQSVLEMIFLFYIDSAEKIIGRRDVARLVAPYAFTLFLFITLSNWSGLLPAVGTFGFWETHHDKEVLIPLFRAPTSDLNMVAALAVFTVGFIQYLGLRFTGPKAYIGKFINLKGPIDFYIGLIELISELTRILSFSFRLFGNVFAGEVLIAVMLFLTSTLLPFLPFIPLPFFFLEMMVGLIQAFIFSFLAIVFSALAVASHGHSEASHAPVKAETEKDTDEQLLAVPAVS